MTVTLLRSQLPEELDASLYERFTLPGYVRCAYINDGAQCLFGDGHGNPFHRLADGRNLDAAGQPVTADEFRRHASTLVASTAVVLAARRAWGPLIRTAPRPVTDDDQWA